MKSHKWKRKQEKIRRQNPTRNVKIQRLLKYTRKIAIKVFEEEQRGMERWFMYGHTPEDAFINDMVREIGDDLKIHYPDILLTYPIYQKMLKELRKKKEKADTINRIYKPLEEDLFTI